MITKIDLSSINQSIYADFEVICRQNPNLKLELSARRSLEKMAEYMAAGVRLGWLMNPQTRQVEIYRYRKEKEVLINPSQLSGEDVLVGLVIDLSKIWGAD